jgi:integrase
LREGYAKPRHPLRAASLSSISGSAHRSQEALDAALSRLLRDALPLQALARSGRVDFEQEVEAERNGATLASEAFVFSSYTDGCRPWQPNWVTKRFIAARREAGVGRFRLHDLRHFMATQMLAAGIPIATVAQRLNHARASTTLNVYAHAVPGGDRKAAEALAAILAQIPEH